MIKFNIPKIFKKSPWDDDNSSENIFTKKRPNFINFNDFNFNSNFKFIMPIIGGIFALWLVTNIFYKVNEGSQALVLRFGKFNRIGTAGLNLRLPSPIEEVLIENVDQSRRLEIGYQSSGRPSSRGTSMSTDIKSKSIMLTGDENIVSLHVDVTWHINDLSKYILNIADPLDTMKASAESAIREVVGITPISAILSNKKQIIADKIEDLMQSILDHYHAGIIIEQIKLLRAEPPEEVIAAYRDVQTAKADKEKIINEAEAYKNDILPRARGEAAKLIEEANGYTSEIISKAKGDVARFDYLYQQYVNGRDVTRTRLYIETIEAILQKANKLVIGADNLLPHMALKSKNNE